MKRLILISMAIIFSLAFLSMNAAATPPTAPMATGAEYQTATGPAEGPSVQTAVTTDGGPAFQSKAYATKKTESGPSRESNITGVASGPAIQNGPGKEALTNNDSAQGRGQQNACAMSNEVNSLKIPIFGQTAAVRAEGGLAKCAIIPGVAMTTTMKALKIAAAAQITT